MEYISKNGSYCEKWVTFGKMGQTVKWLTFVIIGHTIKMSHTVKSRSNLEKWVKL